MTVRRVTATPTAALALAGGMAFLAGATDMYGLSRLHDLFVSFMSGNTTNLGDAIAAGDLRQVLLIVEILACFVAGAAMGTVVTEWTGRRHAASVTAFSAVLLAIGAMAPASGMFPVVLAMGALNAAMSQVGRTRVSLTYVTGTLVKIGEGIGQQLCGKGEGFAWLPHAAMWAFLLAGSTTAAAVQPRLEPYAAWALASLALLLALLAWAGERTGATHRGDGDGSRDEGAEDMTDLHPVHQGNPPVSREDGR